VLDDEVAKRRLHGRKALGIVQEPVELVIAEPLPVLARSPDVDEADTFVGRSGDVQEEAFGHRVSERADLLEIRAPARGHVVDDCVSRREHVSQALSLRFSAPPLPSQIAFRCRTARAVVGDTNRPTNDQTVSDPVLLNALNVPPGRIANCSVLGARPVPHDHETRAVFPDGETLRRTSFAMPAVALAKRVPS
jgi:hypothetical protein